MADQHPAVTIGEPVGDWITVRVHGRGYPGADDFGDGNWLSSEVRYSLGQFGGGLWISLRSEEFRSFRDALKDLYSSLRGVASFESVEGGVMLRVSVTGAGRLKVSGELIDRRGGGNRLEFEIGGLDQSYLPQMIEGLDGILGSFPVLGER